MCGDSARVARRAVWFGMGDRSAGRRRWDIFCGYSSPKRNRLDQCLLGSEESQKRVFLVADFGLKALIIKALIDSYAASQALMPKRCNVLLETVKELPPLQVP